MPKKQKLRALHVSPGSCNVLKKVIFLAAPVVRLVRLIKNESVSVLALSQEHEFFRLCKLSNLQPVKINPVGQSGAVKDRVVPSGGL